jgi:putative tryptophan/tyrosine transport system substrate-binding protein
MRRRDFIVFLGGAAAAWPLAALAQRPDRMRRIGVLMSTAESDPREVANAAAFAQSLEILGWVAGRNLEIAYRWADGDPERMEANAREVVGLAPDVMVVKGANVPAARRATSRIPIVFVVLGEATAQDYVASFARPGGNITGFASFERELVGKRLDLLRQMVPRVANVLYIRSRRTGTDTRALFLRIMEDAAAHGLAVSDAPAENEADIERAVEAFARKPNGGLVIAFDAFNTVHSARIVALAARYRLPAIYPLRLFTESGGLFSYGFDQAEQFRQAASYVDRILRGENPGDLPIQRPNKFELVINLRAAKALGLALPSAVLAVADEVIE